MLIPGAFVIGVNLSPILLFAFGTQNAPKFHHLAYLIFSTPLQLLSQWDGIYNCMGNY